MSRKVGFSLKAIAAQLPAYRARRLGTDQMVESLLARIIEIDQQTDRLKTQRSEVKSYIAWLTKQQREHELQTSRRLPAPGGGEPKAPWPTVRAPSTAQSTTQSATARRKETRP